MNEMFIQQDPSRARLAQAMSQPQQQQQQGPNPMQGYNMYQKFAGGGSAGGATTGGTSAGGGAGGGMGSAMSSGGPWVALAAAITANEDQSRQAGRRPDDHEDWAKDVFFRKQIEDDGDYYGDKVGGAGGNFIRQLGQLSNEEGKAGIVKKSLVKPYEWLKDAF